MFWDASALVPLAFTEPRSPDVLAIAARHAAVVIWWGTPVECHAAAHRRHRERRMALELKPGLQQLREIMSDATVIQPTDAVRERAQRLVAAHPLRAADALQLAAALAWCDEQPGNEAFVCLDVRLRDAARQEGFAVLPDQ